MAISPITCKEMTTRRKAFTLGHLLFALTFDSYFWLVHHLNGNIKYFLLDLIRSVYTYYGCSCRGMHWKPAFWCLWVKGLNVQDTLMRAIVLNVVMMDDFILSYPRRSNVRSFPYNLCYHMWLSTGDFIRLIKTFMKSIFKIASWLLNFLKACL